MGDSRPNRDPWQKLLGRGAGRQTLILKGGQEAAHGGERARTSSGRERRSSEAPLHERWPLLSTTVKTPEPPDVSRNFQLLSGHSHQSSGSLGCSLSAASPGERGKLSSWGRCGEESEGWSDAREGQVCRGEVLTSLLTSLDCPNPGRRPTLGCGKGLCGLGRVWG